MSSRKERSQRVALWLVSGAAATGGFLFGFDQIVISGTVDAVRARFMLSAAEEGFFVSSALIGAMIGAAAAGRLSDSLGRQWSLVLAGLLTLVAAFMAAAAPGPAVLSSARLLGGLGIGIASMVCPLYIAELAPAAVRGRLVTLFQFAITLGILVALVSNAWLAAHEGALRDGLGLESELWRWMLATQALPASLFLALCAGLPESPRWLMQRGESDRAARVLERFIPSTEACAELAEIHRAAPRGALRRILSGHRRALFVALSLAVFSEMSGITVVFYYGPTILTEAGFGFGGALSGIVSIGLVNMLATLIALWLIDHAGRRRLLLAGTIGGVACLLAIALTMARGEQGLLVPLICGFVVFFAFGIGPIKFVMASELFPTAVRGTGAALVTVAVWATGALVNQLFPLIRDAWGASASFAAFGAVLALQIPFVIRFLPETAGRSIEGAFG